jgi:glutathione S-transferase
MPKIFFSTTSPYAAKVRMAATHAGIAFEGVPVDTGPQPKMLTDANPLGKIPVLITDDGESVFDSRVITQWLNRESKSALFPRNPVKRTGAERLEALADGLTDCLLAYRYERHQRPEDKVHQPWLDRQWDKVERTLDFLNANPPGLPRKIHAGHIALRAALGYLELRFSGKWERGRPRLKRWMARFDTRFPELAALTPRE